MENTKCPLCGLHPYEYENIGVGSVPIAVNCCEGGYAIFVQGMSEKEARRHMLEQKVEELKQWPFRHYPTDEDQFDLF